MKKRVMIGIVGLLCALFTVTASAQDEFVFGVVLVGPSTDRGWSQAHFEGAQYVEQNLPGSRMLVFESLNPSDSPNATLDSVVTEMVGQGAQLIITTSDAFEIDTDAVAEKFPEVTFINASGSNALAVKADNLFGEAPAPVATEEALAALPANVGNIMPKMEWEKATAGCVAALTTQTGKIGYLGPLINAETRRYAAASYLGAKHCWETYRGMEAGTLEFTVTWIGFWFNIPGVTLDPTEEVNAFYDSGIDVVISGIDTTEAVVVSGQRRANGDNVWSVAYDNKAGCDDAPDACLGVPYYNWGPEYLKIAQGVQDGTYVPNWNWVGPDWQNPDTSIIGFLPGAALTDTANLEAFRAEMLSFARNNDNAGSIFLWTGPLALQDGTVLAEDGVNVDPLKIWWLPQLLDGMIGKSE
jgi:simple sugar transport system substrate-binding protein